MIDKRDQNLKYQFTCDVCQKSFTQKYNLRSHMIIHERDPNIKYQFTCYLCRKVLLIKTL